MALALLLQGHSVAQSPIDETKPIQSLTGYPFHFVQPLAVHDYDREVLIPLHQAQAREAAIQRAEQEAAAAQAAARARQAAIAANEPQSADWYKAWIYNEESGNNPIKWNAEGCLGLGQACPASKLLIVCPNEDYACEDQFFTNYMLNRYGSWQAAYVFHTVTSVSPINPGGWW